MNVLKRYNTTRHVVVLALILLIPAAALAVDICDPVPLKFDCPDDVPGITYRFTECVKTILGTVADNGITNMLRKLSKVVGAILTLFVAGSGIKMVIGGTRNLKAEALITLVKLGAVAAFALGTPSIPTQNNMVMLYHWIQDMQNGLVDLVSSGLVSNGPCTTVDDADGGPVETNIWKRVDCSILAFIGRTAPTYHTVTDASGNTHLRADVPKGDVDYCDDKGPQPDRPMDGIILFDIPVKQLFTPHGLIVLFLLVAATIMLFIAFAHALQIYVTSLVAVTFLMLLAPIFIPFSLFSQTRQMFVSWYSMILGYAMQPAILIAFLVFLIATLNIGLHGDPTATNPYGLKNALDEMGLANKKDQCTVKNMVVEENAMMGGNIDQDVPYPAAFSRDIKNEINAVTAPEVPIDYADLSSFLVHLIACTMLLYLMMILMENVANFAASLSAGVGPNLAAYGKGLRQLGGAAKDAASSVLK